MTFVRKFPLTITPDGDDVDSGSPKIDGEFNEIYRILNSVESLQLSGSKRQSVLYGSTDASGNPNYLVASGLQVSISAATKPVILAFANGFSTTSGTVDLVNAITANVSNAWTLPASNTCYLYVDQDLSTGLLSYGYSLLPDLYQASVPTSPTLDQHWFNTAEMKMYRWNGSAWEQKLRIFLGSAVTSASTATVSIYPICSRVPLASQGKALNTVDFQSSGSYRNLKAIVTSNTTATITADYLDVFCAGKSPITLTNVNTAIDTSKVGAGGLDAGTIAASTWYYWHIIYNPSTQTTSCLISTSKTAPTLPSGYTHWQWYGSFRVDASKYFMRTQQNGDKVQYIVTPSTNTPNLPVIASGIAGNVSIPTYVPVSVATVVPITAKTITIILGGQGNFGQAILAPNGNYGALSTSQYPPWISVNCYADSYGGSYSAVVAMCLESNSVHWAASSSGARLQCCGWEENI